MRPLGNVSRQRLMFFTVFLEFLATKLKNNNNNNNNSNNNSGKMKKLEGRNDFKFFGLSPKQKRKQNWGNPIKSIS